MNTHPYRATGLDAGAQQAEHAPGCIFCRIKRALPRVRWRTLLIATAALVFAAVNVASAVVGQRSLREAKRVLATADSLDAATRTTLSRYEARLRQSASPPHAETPQARPADVRSNPPQGIVRISDTEFYVDRILVDDAILAGTEHMGQPHLLPEKENGKVSGVRVFGVRPDTLFGMLGIQSGDSIQAVDGFDITRPENALDAYARLRTATDLTVRIRRRGSTLNLRYHLT